MKKIIFMISVLIPTISCYTQEVEMMSSINTSTEQRLQNAFGIGAQYQQNLFGKYKLGLACHLNYNNSNFDYIPYLDASPNSVASDEIESSAYRFSVRFNLQKILKDNDFACITIGPELSYNFLWGNDHNTYRMAPDFYFATYSEKIHLVRNFGLGFVFGAEIKQVFTPQTSLCFAYRPEMIIDTELFKGGTIPFREMIGLNEFQLGIKYRFL
jgi:hypothetical protein